jgi:hypothetical protein
LNDVLLTFKRNIESVESLLNFDRKVLDMAIDSIQELNEYLVDYQKISADQYNGKRTLDTLKAIRNNDSLKSKYAAINNQAIVLLVSYFGSAVADIFRRASKIAVDTHNDERVLGEELKFKLEELLNLKSSLADSIGELLITKNNISFQDMKSIQREFKKYFGIKIDRDINVNNIILGQACRHSIAHEAAKVNARVINQIRGAKPRNLKENLVVGQVIEFNQTEIKIVSDSMLNYVRTLNDQVSEYGQPITNT